MQTLATLYQLNLKQDEIERLMDRVERHPYLIQLAMYQMKTQDCSLEQFLAQILMPTGIYNNLLQALASILDRFPELSIAFGKLINSNTPILLNPLQVYQLHSLDLIKHQGNLISPRCKLYRDYFRLKNINIL